MYLTIWPQKGNPYTLNLGTDEGTLVSVAPLEKGRKEVEIRTKSKIPHRVIPGDIVRLDYPIDKKHASGILLHAFAYTLKVEIGPTVNNA